MKYKRIKDKTITPNLDLAVTSSIQDIPVVNLEEGMPTVDLALRRLQAAITTHKRKGATVLKIIHGYGSSGIGGKIKFQAHKFLRQMVTRKEIVNYIPGEEFDRTSIFLQYRSDFPQIDWDPDFGRKQPWYYDCLDPESEPVNDVY